MLYAYKTSHLLMIKRYVTLIHIDFTDNFPMYTNSQFILEVLAEMQAVNTRPLSTSRTNWDRVYCHVSIAKVALMIKTGNLHSFNTCIYC